MVWQTLAVVSLLVWLVHGDWEHTCNQRAYQRASIGKCGPNLRSLVESVCSEIHTGKRSSDIHRQLETSFLNHKQILPKDHPLGFLRASKRSSDGFSTGIVCECCVNRCSQLELAQYCASKRKRRSLASVKRADSNEHLLEEFYRNLDLGEPIHEKTIPSVEDLLQDPIIQQLNLQKLANMEAENGEKRTSSEIEDERLLNLKEYLRRKLQRILAEARVDHTESTIEDRNIEGKDAEEKILIDRLWALLHEDEK